MKEHGRAAAGPERTSLLQGIAATAALLAGTAVYLADRSAGSITVFPAAWTGLGSAGAAFGAAGGWLPSLAHTFAFAILTGLWAADLGQRLIACAAWAAIGCAFELGQYRAVAHGLAAAFDGEWSGLPYARALSAYFSRGTFDPLDLAATLAGGALAALLFASLTEAEQ